MASETSKTQLLLVHTPHTLHVLTPDNGASFSLDFSELLQQRVSNLQPSLPALLAPYRKLPTALLFSADLLPITQHPLPALLSRHAQRRFLRHYYPGNFYAQGLAVVQANQQINLVSCAFATASFHAVLRSYRNLLPALQQMGPLAGWLPHALRNVPGTHLLLLNSAFARSLVLIKANQLTYVINQAASFEELFRCLSHQAPHCAWEQGINLLDNSSTAIDAPNIAPWLDAWYWFAE